MLKRHTESSPPLKRTLPEEDKQEPETIRYSAIYKYSKNLYGDRSDESLRAAGKSPAWYEQIISL